MVGLDTGLGGSQHEFVGKGHLLSVPQSEANRNKGGFSSRDVRDALSYLHGEQGNIVELDSKVARTSCFVASLIESIRFSSPLRLCLCVQFSALMFL